MRLAEAYARAQSIGRRASSDAAPASTNPNPTVSPFAHVSASAALATSADDEVFFVVSLRKNVGVVSIAVGVVVVPRVEPPRRSSYHEPLREAGEKKTLSRSVAEAVP